MQIRSHFFARQADEEPLGTSDDVRCTRNLMHIILKCPRCGYRWWLDFAAVDRRVRCRKCFLLLKVPHPAELSNATDILNDAESEVYVDDTGKLYG